MNKATAIASLFVPSFENNEIFQADHPRNRDQVLTLYIVLREYFSQHGIELNTADVNQGRPVLFELHQDAHDPTAPGSPAYSIFFETPSVYPRNQITPALRRQYRKIFTWNDALVDNREVVSLKHPCGQIVIPEVDGFKNRPRFCCIISGNKTTKLADPNELYSERVNSIRWFERHAPSEFDLYGTNWDAPPRRNGFGGKLQKRLWSNLLRPLGLRPFPSYRGKVKNKREVLLNTRFSICYENVQGLPGYISEKIFDSFFAGCIPLYWGATNITDYIPANCFVDRRHFKDTGEAYRHMQAMKESEYLQYQKNIRSFLQSSEAQSFSSETIAKKMAAAVIEDLATLQTR